MKRISIPLEFRFTRSSDGFLHVDLLEIAMKNGSDVVYAALSLERFCTEIISHHFFSGREPLKADLEEWILAANWCSFENKRAMLFRIIDRLGLLAAVQRSDFERSFARVIEYRNAFAHGTIEQVEEDVLLSYYRGGLVRRSLSDEFWKELEGHFEFCSSIIRSIYERFVCVQPQQTPNKPPQPMTRSATEGASESDNGARHG